MYGYELSALEIHKRGATEAKHFLERFPNAVPQRRLKALDIAGWLGWCVSIITYGGDDAEEKAILLPARPEVYPYVRDAARYLGEAFYLTNTDPRYTTPNYYRHFSFVVYRNLIHCTPSEKMDEEYSYWRKYYSEKAEPVIKKNHLQELPQHHTISLGHDRRDVPGPQKERARRQNGPESSGRSVPDQRRSNLGKSAFPGPRADVAQGRRRRRLEDLASRLHPRRSSRSTSMR